MEALLADGGGRRRRRDARRWPPPSPQSLLQSSMPPPLPPPLPSAPPSTPPSPQRPLPPDAPHGRGPLGTVKPPPPPSIPKAHCSRSRHPGRRHRPCRHLDRNLRLCLALRRVWEGLMALPPLSLTRPVRKKNAPRPRRIGAIAMLHFTRRARLYRLYRRVYRGTRVQSHVGERVYKNERERERAQSRPAGAAHPIRAARARARV